MIQAINLLGPGTARVNLLSMIRIWKAQVFMGLVDHYGDVPYSEAGKAVSDGIFYPKYDDDAAIYDDLYKELKEAIAALNPVVNLFLLIFFMEQMLSLQLKRNCCSPGGQVEKIGQLIVVKIRNALFKSESYKSCNYCSRSICRWSNDFQCDNAFVKIRWNILYAR